MSVTSSSSERHRIIVTARKRLELARIAQKVAAAEISSVEQKQHAFGIGIRFGGPKRGLGKRRWEYVRSSEDEDRRQR